MYKLRSSSKLAVNWFLNSGIQNIQKGKDTYGSFNSWFDIKNNKFSFAYSEITGYGITTLLYLYSLSEGKSNILLDRAKIAADWLMKKAFNQEVGGIRCRYDFDLKKFSERICSFDNAMCLNAFVNLFKQTGDKKYLNFSIKIANWILRMQKKNDSFYTRFFTDNNTLEETGDKWSKQSGSFHAKIAIGLLNLGLLLGEGKYINRVKRICDFALKFQKDDGRFITDVNTKGTFLHPACYTAEGLLTAAIVLKDKKYINAVKKFVKWILKNKLETNGFPAYFLDGNFIPVESPEINSQVLRLCLILNSASGKILSRDVLDFCIKRLLKYQCQIKSKKTYGGFYSGEAWFYKEKNLFKEHVNSWVTMFILQVLFMTDRRFNQDDIFYLV